MKLSEKQRYFVRAIAELLTWAHTQGYEFTFGDAMATTGHTKNSYHYKRLAIDLNLFIDGEYQTTTESHALIGKKWKELGGTWGGDFKNPDGNHYSWGEKRK